jgi:hypothetical protein
MFPRGFPLYPSYIHQPDRLAALSGDQRIKVVSHYQNTGADGSLVLHSVHESTSITEIYQSPTENCRLAAIFTDGILSFSGLVQTQTSKSVTSIPIQEVLLDLLSFKSFNGAFLRRRFKRVREQYQRKGWINQDDLGCGILYFGTPDRIKAKAAATSPNED